MRAAAFQAGVLWRLAEAGALSQVEHLVAVSGGAYIASAFASTVLRESEDVECDVERWRIGMKCT